MPTYPDFLLYFLLLFNRLADGLNYQDVHRLCPHAFQSVYLHTEQEKDRQLIESISYHENISLEENYLVQFNTNYELCSEEEKHLIVDLLPDVNSSLSPIYIKAIRDHNCCLFLHNNDNTR